MFYKQISNVSPTPCFDLAFLGPRGLFYKRLFQDDVLYDVTAMSS